MYVCMYVSAHYWCVYVCMYLLTTRSSYLVPIVEQLREEVEIADESGLQNDRHVGGVEELDGVLALLSAELGVLDGQVDTPP